VKVLCAVLVSALVGGLPCLSHAQTTSDSSIDQIIAPQAVPADAAVVTPSQPAVFKSGVDLVALKVIVTDPQQKYVTDLAQGDFAVYEDGVMQDVSYFAMGAVPLDLAILLDVSASMGDKLLTVQQAASGFARSLGPQDRAAIVGFNDGVRIFQDFTNDITKLEAAINGITTRGATAMHNALYVTLKQFQKTAHTYDGARRQAIVLLSDGQDTASPISFEDVLDVAKRTGVSIYTISLVSKMTGTMNSSGTKRYFSQNEFSMRTLAQETGAQSFFPLRIQDLAGVYGQIATELSHQYALGYYSKNQRPDGAFRRVVVRVVSRPEARPRTRTGYFAQAVTRAALGTGSK
jgi:Ca-activated chloride channel homolog